MSSSKSDPVLHLQLDQHFEQNGQQQAIDISRNANHGTIRGAPQLVLDETFGWCFSFGGGDDAIEIPAVMLDGEQPAHTIEAWIKLESAPTARAWLLLLGQAGALSHHWLVGDGSTAFLGAWGGAQVAAALPL